MTQTQLNMVDLYHRLSKLGFNKTFVQTRVLPDWWDNEFEEDSGAAVEAAAHISRRLNLDIASLLGAESSPQFNECAKTKFKTKQGTTSQHLLLAHSMAARIAQMVSYACQTKFKAIPASAFEVREAILQTQPFVSLDGLLQFCWGYGIPVVHFDGFPAWQGFRKFDGMVGYFYGRPVIVISLKHRSMARLLFIVAHELGHICRQHIEDTTENSQIIDTVNLAESNDEEEIEANEFAVELLLGKSDMCYATPRNFNGGQLAEYAQHISRRDRVDPGVIALNYGWNKKHWGVASSALKHLEPNANAPIQINRCLAQYLDLDRLDIDSQDYLARATEA
jgi:uncharacterized membrane protein